MKIKVVMRDGSVHEYSEVQHHWFLPLHLLVQYLDPNGCYTWDTKHLDDIREFCVDEEEKPLDICQGNGYIASGNIRNTGSERK